MERRIPPKPRESQGAVERRVAGGKRELGRLGRISSSGQHKHADSRRRSRRSSRMPTGERGNKEGAAMRYWLMLLLIGGGLVFCGMMLWSLFSQRSGDAAIQASSESSEHGDSTSAIQPLTAEQAEQLAKHMLDADSVDAIRPLIRPDGALSPEEAFATLRKIENEHGEAGTPFWQGYSDSLTSPTEVVSVRYKGGARKAIPFFAEPEHGWRIDFDAFAEFCDPPFDSLFSDNASGGLIRAIAKSDFYYNGIYRDDQQWICYSLRSSSSDITLYGYCEHDSPAADAMRGIEERMLQARRDRSKDSIPWLPQGSTTQKLPFLVTLTIEKKPDSSANQFLISEVVADGWVIGETSLNQVIQARGGR